MNRRNMAVFLAVVLIICFLCACSDSVDSATILTGEESDIDRGNISEQDNTDFYLEDFNFDWSIYENYDWGLYNANCNVVYYPKSFSYGAYLYFKLVSSSPLTEEDIQLSSDTDWTFLFNLEAYDFEEGKNPLYENIFLLTQGISAEEQEAFSVGKLSEERRDEIWEILRAFRALEEDKVPVVYLYTFYLAWTDTSSNPDAVLDGIDITVKGVTRHIDLGHISYCYEEADFSFDPDFRLNRDDNISYMGYGVEPSKDGAIEFRNVKYTAMTDLTITGVRFYRNDDIEIQEISVMQEIDEDVTINITWDGSSPLELSKGDVIYLTVKATDPWFAGTASGWKSEYLLVDYLVGSECYTVPVSFYCCQSISDAFAYIALDQGYDVLPLYYRDN